jgi:hypothetical protein
MFRVIVLTELALEPCRVLADARGRILRFDDYLRLGLESLEVLSHIFNPELDTLRRVFVLDNKERPFDARVSHIELGLGVILLAINRMVFDAVLKEKFEVFLGARLDLKDMRNFALKYALKDTVTMTFEHPFIVRLGILCERRTFRAGTFALKIPENLLSTRDLVSGQLQIADYIGLDTVTGLENPKGASAKLLGSAVMQDEPELPVALVSDL